MVVLLRLLDVLVMMYPLVVSVMGSYFMTVRAVDHCRKLSLQELLQERSTMQRVLITCHNYLHHLKHVTCACASRRPTRLNRREPKHVLNSSKSWLSEWYCVIFRLDNVNYFQPSNRHQQSLAKRRLSIKPVINIIMCHFVYNYCRF